MWSWNNVFLPDLFMLFAVVPVAGFLLCEKGCMGLRSSGSADGEWQVHQPPLRALCHILYYRDTLIMVRSAENATFWPAVLHIYAHLNSTHNSNKTHMPSDKHLGWKAHLCSEIMWVWCVCVSSWEKKKKKCYKNGIDYKILESDSTSPTTFHVAYTHSIAYDHMIIESISHMLHSLKNTVVAYSNIACLWPSQCHRFWWVWVRFWHHLVENVRDTPDGKHFSRLCL